jgi:trehalose 6-phosphate phosphatase
LNGLLKEIHSKILYPQWLVALDRDGTLVPYADRPEQARVNKALYTLLGDLAQIQGFHIAIVSARSVAQLHGDFDSENLILAGNYGMEVSFPDGRTVVQPKAQTAVPQLKELRDQLAHHVGLTTGAILEDHGYSLCLHWHKVPLSFRDDLHYSVTELLAKFPDVKLRRLPTSYEMVPDMPWDKSRALACIDAELDEPPEQRFYFYAGDTEADTPAFHWVNERGGISIRIGKVQQLGAGFRLDRPADLLHLLQHISTTRAAQNVVA